jgi:epoxyqueuosine reductase
MELRAQVLDLVKSHGLADAGFSMPPDGPKEMPYAISIVAALSDAVIDEIDGAPTYTYFHHYRTVNAFIDRVLLEIGFLLQNNGYRYIPIAASQSVPSLGQRSHAGRYSHKKTAVLAGLGTIGKSTLFLHPVFGPRVRLGTLFTDCPLATPAVVKSPQSLCGDCTLCVKACPAGAIKGAVWQEGLAREAMLDADACNRYMRAHFMQIGRGAVCGICIKVCQKCEKNKES